MREIALFVEDHAHQQVIGALLNRIAGEFNSEMAIAVNPIVIEPDVRSSRTSPIFLVVRKNQGCRM